MPPPPPPSASYNLKLDDFSDSEDNDYYSHQHSSLTQTTAPLPNIAAASTVVHKTDGYLVQDAPVISLSELRQKYAEGKVSKEEFAAALRAHQATSATTTAAAVKSNGQNTANENQRMMVDGEQEPEVVEAINVKVLSDDSDNDDECEDNSNNSKMDVDGQNTADGDEVSSPVRKKKKKKKKVGASVCHLRLL